ncbi:MAG TPA: hypothetical protein VGI86_04430 [Acidimicrobiia bacterium]
MVALHSPPPFEEPDLRERPQPGSADAVLAGTRAAAVYQRRVGRAVFVAVLVAFGAFVAPRTAQPASRYALTASLVDQHTVDIGHYQAMLGVDRALFEGHLRSDKGPGQPVLAAPFYMLARAVGAPAISAKPRKTDDLMLWWLTLTTSVVPFALLCALIYRRCARAAPRAALPATLALMIASIALPVSTSLFAHSLSALLGYAAYALIVDTWPSRWRMVAAGALAAAAIATEYQLVIVAAVVAALALWRAPKRFHMFVLGAIAPLAGLGWYQWRAFGSPWQTPFKYYAGVIDGQTHGGYTWPKPAWLFDSTLGNRGLLLMCPIVLVGVVAAVAVAAKRPAYRRDGVVALVVFVLYLALVSGWSGTPLLEDPGPRYMIAAFPFVAVPLALCWRRLRLVAICAALWGAWLMIGAATTDELVGIGESPVRQYATLLSHRQFLPTVWSLELGPNGAWVYAASVVLVSWWLVRTYRRRGRQVRERLWIH